MNKIIGPGIFVYISFLDPGTLAGNVEAGASSGYKLLWLLLLATILSVIFQSYAIKIGIYTKKDITRLCRSHMTSFQNIILWIMTEISIISADIQGVLGGAIALNILFKIPIFYGVIFTLSMAFFILFLSVFGQDKLEISFAFLIGIMAFSFCLNLFFIEIEYELILSGLLIPKIETHYYAAALGLIGATIMPHNIYYHSSLIRQKKYYLQPTEEKNQIFKLQKIEIIFYLFFCFVINSILVISFAYFSKTDQTITLENAGEILKKNFGQFAAIIWAIGLYTSGQSSTLATTLAGQYIMEGFLGLKINSFKRAIFTRLVAILPSLFIALADKQEDFSHYLNVIQAIQLPFALIILLKFNYNEKIMGVQKMQKIDLIILSFLALTLIGINYYDLIFNNELSENSSASQRQPSITNQQPDNNEIEDENQNLLQETDHNNNNINKEQQQEIKDILQIYNQPVIQDNLESQQEQKIQ